MVRTCVMGRCVVAFGCRLVVACYSPLFGYRSRTPGKSGGFGIVFKRSLSNGQCVSVPCGQCIGCRLDRSREWAVRCVHEAQISPTGQNCFVTLTYRDSDLPIDGSLVKWHFVDFMKRLRRHYEPKRIRFFMCGEYGERLDRPHYHACLFNLDFEDRVFHSSEDGFKLYTSQILEDRWEKGFCTVGELNFETAAYTARYVMKKITGDDAYLHYVNDDGVMLEPEYCRMSTGGRYGHGLGHDWYTEFGEEVFPSDEVIMRGHVMGVPRFYEKILALEAPVVFDEVKRKRNEFFAKHKEDCHWRRLESREAVKRAQIGMLKRSFEEV